MKKIVLMISFLTLFIGLDVQAETKGCCEILQQSGVSRYETMTKQLCDNYNTGFVGQPYAFKENEVAKSDKTGCEREIAEEAIKVSKPTPPQLSVSIPGFGKFSDVTCDDKSVSCQIPWIAEYIKALYNYGLLIIGVLSVIVMMIGGVMRITAAGNKQQISHANSFISGSILGATIAVCSYLILYLANPNLVIWKPIDTGYIGRLSLEEIKEIEDAIGNHGLSPLSGFQGANCNESEWATVPNDSTLGIYTGKPERSCPDSVAALKKAAQCMKKINPNYKIRVSDASRTMAEQRSLWNAYQNGTGALACNPANGPTGCPHTSGQAFDAWGCLNNQSGACKNSQGQSDLQDCMIQAGFCLLEKECWHFEMPKLSGACGSTKNYAGKWCVSLKP